MKLRMSVAAVGPLPAIPDRNWRETKKDSDEVNEIKVLLANAWRNSGASPGGPALRTFAEACQR